MDKPILPLTPEQRIKELEEQLALANQKAKFFEDVADALSTSVVKNGLASRCANPNSECQQAS